MLSATGQLAALVSFFSPAGMGLSEQRGIREDPTPPTNFSLPTADADVKKKSASADVKTRDLGCSHTH